jgi:hypothetical protein
VYSSGGSYRVDADQLWTDGVSRTIDFLPYRVPLPIEGNQIVFDCFGNAFLPPAARKLLVDFFSHYHWSKEAEALYEVLSTIDSLFYACNGCHLFIKDESGRVVEFH